MQPDDPQASPSPLPAPFRNAWEEPALPRRGWQAGLAPGLIGLFLWVAFYDQIPQETLPRGGLIWPVLGAGLGGLLCYLLLYETPAMWGQVTRRPLAVLATSTFGIRGATIVPGLLLCGVQVVWLAVATLYATTLLLRGLVLLQLLDPRTLPNTLEAGPHNPGLFFATVALAWALAAAFTGRYLVRVIAALMNVFPIVPAALLGTTTVLAIKGFAGVAFGDGAPRAASDLGSPGLASLLVTVQMIFGFYATSGLLAADSGTIARSPKDVRLAGWVGVGFSCWVIVTLAILSVAGTLAREGRPGAARVPGSFRYTTAVETLIPGRWAGAALLAFGLAALAPACYASFLFATRMKELVPRISRSRWTIVIAVLGWWLAAFGMVGRLYDVFGLVGGLIAPVVGALAADRARSRGAWPGPRVGWNAAGLIAWLLGASVAIAPTLARLAGSHALDRVEPASVIGFVVAFVAYLVLALLGVEAKVDPRFAPGQLPAERLEMTAM